MKGDSERIVRRVEAESYDEARTQAWQRWLRYLGGSVEPVSQGK